MILAGGVVPVSAVGGGGLGSPIRGYPPAASAGGYAPIAAGDRNVDLAKSRPPLRPGAFPSDSKSFARDDPSQFATNRSSDALSAGRSSGPAGRGKARDQAADDFASEVLKLPDGRAKYVE